MKKRTKRTLTLLLALVLCLGLLPTAALAGETTDEVRVSVLPGPPPPEPNQGSTRTEVIDGGPGSVEVIDKNDKNKDDGPVAEDTPSERVFITFDCAGKGKFSNGEPYVTLEADYVSDHDPKWKVQFPDEDPVSLEKGYIFDGWYMWSDSGTEIPVPEYVSKGDTVAAKWTKAAPWWSDRAFKLDANGGNVFPDTVTLDENLKIVGKLPIPSRPGYVFQGWYFNGLLADESTIFSDFPKTPAPILLAQWDKDTAPVKSEAPFRVDFYPNGGSIVSIRGLAAKDIVPGSTKAQENKVFVDTKSGIGMMETGKDGRLDSFPEIEREGYVLEGWYIVSGAMDDAYSGKEIALPSGAKKADLTTVFKDRAYLAAKWTKGEGPFTVKFDLNYKNAPKAQVPKEQKIAKGQTVDLPDGKKLTAPAENLEFYAWCMKGADDKLYPWKDSTAVTADMTLYAGWVKKGTTVKDGEAVPDASKPAAPKFSDVPPTSAFADAIAWAVEQGIANGKTADSFGPNDPCSRAHIITFLYRAAGSPEPKAAKSPYTDAVSTAYYYKAALWAAEMGMVDPGAFSPNAPCTRGQAMYFIWKAKGSASSAGSAPSFKDLPKDHIYYDAVLWAVGQGVTNGKTADTFGPNDPCTRAHIVTFLYRAYAK